MTYELVTECLGFRCHSGEGKTIGIAPYGRVDIALLPDFCDAEFGLPNVRRYAAFLGKHFTNRRPGEPIDQRNRDLAATLQHYFERSLLAMADWLRGEPDWGFSSWRVA